MMRPTLTLAGVLFALAAFLLLLAYAPLSGAAMTGQWLLAGSGVNAYDGSGDVEPPTDPQLVARLESASSFEQSLLWQGLASAAVGLVLLAAACYVLGARYGMPVFRSPADEPPPVEAAGRDTHYLGT